MQTALVVRGERPQGRRALWGHAAPDDRGTLANTSGRLRVPSAQGDCCRCYEAFAAAFRSRRVPPVDAARAAAVLAVLEAARESVLMTKVVQVVIDHMS